MPGLFKEPSRPRKPWRVDWREAGRKRTTRFASKGEARRFIQDLERGRRPADARITLEEWVVEWLTTHGQQWEPRTRGDRAWIMDRYVLPHLGGMLIRELAPRTIRDWRRHLTTVTTPFQVNRATQVLSAAMGAAVSDDVITVNPCRGVRRIPAPRTRRGPADLYEVEGIRLCMPDPVDRLAVSLMAYCGLRPSEVRSVRWEDVIGATIVVRRGERVSGATKTGVVRSVPLITPVVDDIQAAGGGTGTVLPVAAANWRHRHWDPARRAAGAGHVTPYMLRHTAASLWIAEGLTVFEVAARLGHSTPALTLSTYGHLFAEAQIRPGEGMEAAVVRARAHLASIAATAADATPA